MKFICAAALFLLTALACGQEPSSQPEILPLAPGAPGSVPKPHADEGLLKLDVAVTDKSGKAVAGLKAQDFTLLDNGQPNNILSFHAFDGTSARPDPPAKVILVIDAAYHSADEVSDEQRGVDQFLLQNGGHLAQPVSIYRLSNEGLFAGGPPSADGNALSAQISQKGGLSQVAVGPEDLPFNITMAAPSPSFRNPNYRRQSALEALGSIVLIERRNPGRKLLVWIDPGKSFDENSFEWVTEFSTRIREARITLFSVQFWKNPDSKPLYENFVAGVQSAAQSKADNLLLQVLALQSGGRVEEAPDNDLARLIGICARDASSFYTISFDPPRTEQPDEYHDLKVEVAQPELIARTNTGYYDQPVFYDQPYRAAERITVEQLEQLLEKPRGKSDAELGRQLSGIELTERMSSAKLLAWKERLKGGKAWAALAAVADASVFLDPAPTTVPDRPAPDVVAQQQMLSRTVDYLLKTIPKLPDFFATRITTRYQEPPLKEGQTWKKAIGDRRLHPVGSSPATVLYRNGYEVVDLGPAKGKKPSIEKGRLITKGMFGPILSVVILDAARSALVWSHWEQGATGPRAVFRYSVPKERSHYGVTYRSLSDRGEETGDLQRLYGYHGEIAIDPETGAILRLAVEADLDANLPIIRSDIMVEYGPVEIGGSTCICLARSVSIARIRTVFGIYEWGEGFKIYGPFETMLDDVSFGEYHMFHGEARILSDYDPSPEQK